MFRFLMIAILASLFTGGLAAQDVAAGEAAAQTEDGDQAVTSPIDPVLMHYQSIRARLAADNGAELPELATALAAAATAAAEDLPEGQREDALALAAAARALAETDTQDLAALRKAFGEVSRPLIAILARHPELRERYHLFTCPMAKGHGSWVQAEEAKANPYMGSRMLRCGSAVGWDRTVEDQKQDGGRGADLEAVLPGGSPGGFSLGTSEVQEDDLGTRMGTRMEQPA